MARPGHIKGQVPTKFGISWCSSISSLLTEYTVADLLVRAILVLELGFEGFWDLVEEEQE